MGETDSEELFCALLTKLSNERISFADFQAIESILRGVNQSGTMNLLFSEGEHLFAYRDRNGYNGLYLTERSAPFGRVRLVDEEWEVDLREEKDPDQRGVVIASRPLTDEPWDELPPGSLSVFRRGMCVYGP